MCTEIKDVKEMSRLMYTLFKDIQCIFLNKNKLQIYKSNKQEIQLDSCLYQLLPK